MEEDQRSDEAMPRAGCWETAVTTPQTSWVNICQNGLTMQWTAPH